MCQIIQGPSAKIKQVLLNTEGLLEQLHRNNPDGWGAMYHTASGSKAIKKLPKSAAETRKLIEKLPADDRLVALHWRWKTSGLVDMENAHPHFVEGGWLIHNGILDVDMKADKDRCDTHHFARQYLDGSMAHLVRAPKLLTLLGEFIGNNRFVLMDDSGTMAIVNAHQGYMAQGLWFANDYSMDRDLVDPTYRPKRRTYKGSQTYESPLDSWDQWGGAKYDDSASRYDLTDEEDDTFTVAECVANAIEMQDADEMEELLATFPLDTLRHIFETYDVDEYENTDDEDLTPAVVAIRQALCRRDVLDLMERLEEDVLGSVANRVATTLIWFCTIEPKMTERNTLKELA